MKIHNINFFKKGVQVTIAEASMIDPLTLAASFTADKVVGYKPEDGEKTVKEHGWGVFAYNGVKHLALKRGYTYEVKMSFGDKESVEVIAVDSADAIIPIADGVKVSAKRRKKED